MKINIGAFEYDSENESQLAMDEQAKIAKLEEKMDYNNPKLVYSLYCKLVGKRVFKTPEGFLYLLHLQDYLTNNENELEGPIPTIPADMFTKTVTKEIVKTVEVEVPVEVKVEVPVEVPVAAAETSDENTLKESEDEFDDEELQADMKRIQERNMEDLMRKYKKTVTKNTKLRERLMFQRIAILLLIVIVVVMLTIAKKNDSPTILNYREKIQDEYAGWEQQLKEKEQQLNEREKALEN